MCRPFHRRATCLFTSKLASLPSTVLVKSAIVIRKSAPLPRASRRSLRRLRKPLSTPTNRRPRRTRRLQSKPRPQRNRHRKPNQHRRRLAPPRQRPVPAQKATAANQQKKTPRRLRQPAVPTTNRAFIDSSARCSADPDASSRAYVLTAESSHRPRLVNATITTSIQYWERTASRGPR